VNVSVDYAKVLDAVAGELAQAHVELAMLRDATEQLGAKAGAWQARFQLLSEYVDTDDPVDVAEVAAVVAAMPLEELLPELAKLDPPIGPDLAAVAT